MKRYASISGYLLIQFVFGVFGSFAQREASYFVLNSQLAPFYHGVASGDPLHDRVIIWTRVTPDSANFNSSIPVTYMVATDTNFTDVVNTGAVYAEPTSDFTVKVDVTGLSPGKVYYYVFNALGANSVVGRTRTAPAGNVDSLRFAVVSCANYEAGYFNAYAAMLKRNDFEAVIHLGDYIYEYETGGYAPNTSTGRTWLPSNEIITLSDYRMRHSHYKGDPDLRRLHQNFPWITIWDDHESANDAYIDGAQNHTPSTEGPWLNRKNASVQAYFEWMPIRDGNQNQTIFRAIKYGDLLHLVMLDTRLYAREEQSGTTGSTVNNPNRELLGPDQRNWLFNILDTTQSMWKVLAQQVMVAPLKIAGVAVNGDQWDGYPAERSRLYNHILNNNIQNVAVLTGDIHSSWANDLPSSNYNSSTGAGSVAVEFVTPSVTSPGLSLGVGTSVIMAANKHMKYIDLNKHGYILLDVNKNRTQSEWYFVSTIDQPSTAEVLATRWMVNRGERFLRQAPVVSSPSPKYNVPLVSALPRNVSASTFEVKDKQPLIFNLYPNPVNDNATLQIYFFEPTSVSVEVYEVSGKLTFSENMGFVETGLHYLPLKLQHIPSGIYTVRVLAGKYVLNRNFVKK